MKRKVIIGLLSLLIVAGAVAFSAYLINAKALPSKDNAKVNAMYVKAEKVEYVELGSSMTYRGRVTAFDNVSLAAEVSGRIMQGDVRFKAGEQFNKNDIIIEIYREDVEASMKAGKSSFLQTVSRILPDIKVDFPGQYDKWTRFFVSIDPLEPLPALPEMNSDKERVFMASNNVLTNYYTLQQQEISLRKYVVRAPFKGSFISVNKEIGAVASPGAELANIVRSDKLEIIVPVFPDDLKWIRKGDEVEVSGNSGAIQKAVVSRISGFVDEATQSVNVYLTYYAPGSGGFLLGEYVDVVFRGGKVSGFEIPREALLDDAHVYELRDNSLLKVKVDIERQLDDAVIISGIDTSRLIVTESLSSVNPAMEYLAR